MPRTAFSTAAVAALLAARVLGADVSIDRVEVGFGGAYRAGEWTPLEVRVRSRDASAGPVIVETITADAEGSSVVRRSNSLALETSGSAGVVRTVFQAGRLGSDLTVRLLTSELSLIDEIRLRAGSKELPAAHSRNEPLWLTAGTFNAARAAEEATLPLPVPTRPVSGELPATPLALAAVDVLIVPGDLRPSPAQIDTLRRWVTGGGHLAIALGEFTDEFLSGPLADWVPIEVGEAVPLTDVSALENFPRRARVRIAQLREAAESLPRGSDTPLVATSPHGFGRVTMFAMDLNRPPFSTWPGLADLIREVLVEAEADSSRERRISAPGVTELDTQLLRAQESQSGVLKPTVGSALLLLLVYAAIVGPLDYLLVHRILRLPALTWLTLPLIVAGAAWWLDRNAAANGATSRVTALHVLDHDAGSGTLRGRTTISLYASDSVRASLDVTPDVGASAVGRIHLAPLVWRAPFEATFGGIDREAAGGLFRPEYLLPPAEESARGESVPLLVRAGRHFEAAWQREGIESLVESDLSSGAPGLLEGTVRHRFPGPVQDYVIAFGKQIFRPRESAWHPGDPIDPGSAAFERLDLHSYLTRKRTTRVERKPGQGGSEFVVSESDWDPLSTELSDVLRMLTFHSAAGGTGYTGLTNSARDSDDLSPLLRFGRAVVFGRIEVAPSEVVVRSDSGREFIRSGDFTFVRLVLPVAGSQGSVPTTLPPLAPTHN